MVASLWFVFYQELPAAICHLLAPDALCAMRFALSSGLSALFVLLSMFRCLVVSAFVARPSVLVPQSFSLALCAMRSALCSRWSVVCCPVVLIANC